MKLLLISKRNIKLFFRDKTAVFFSLLSVIIIIALYIFFLGDMLVKGMSDMGEGARFLIDSWIMAGLLAVNSVTAVMGAFGVMIDDRTKKISNDFAASPIKRSSLAGGYIVSSFVIGVIMCLVTLGMAEIYITAYGGHLLSLSALAKVFGILLLSVLSASAMVFLLVSFFKTNSSYATASTVIGTLIGFLTGIYIPIGSLPDTVQTIIKFFPPSHAGALFRQVMMNAPAQTVFNGAPAEMVRQFNQDMGVQFWFGSWQVTPLASVLFLVVTTILCYGLAVLRISKKG